MYLQSNYHSLLIRSENKLPKFATTPPPLPTHPRFPAPKGFVHKLGPKKPPMMIPDKQAASIKNDEMKQPITPPPHRPTPWAFFPVTKISLRKVVDITAAGCLRLYKMYPVPATRDSWTNSWFIYPPIISARTNLGVTQFLIPSYVLYNS